MAIAGAHHVKPTLRHTNSAARVADPSPAPIAIGHFIVSLPMHCRSKITAATMTALAKNPMCREKTKE